jgi:hypothetical protein
MQWKHLAVFATNFDNTWFEIDHIVDSNIDNISEKHIHGEKRPDVEST